MLSKIEMKSSNYIYFGLAGEFDPLEVENIIDLKPTESMAKHARFPERKLPKCSLMRFAQTHFEEEAVIFDTYKLAEKVIEILEPYQDQISYVVQSFELDATLEVVFELPTSEEISTPILGFSNRVINFLSAVGASIDMDSYHA
jgi:hypothetical protein